MKLTEADIAAAVIERIQHDGWEVYQEADLPACAGRCDIAATRNGLLWIIETKKSASLALLDQAFQRLGAAHMVSVAYFVKRDPYRTVNCVPWIFCQQFGIGLIALTPKDSPWSGEVTLDMHRMLKAKMCRPHRMDRSAVRRNIAALHPNMNNYQAGTSGKWWTPFKETMDRCHKALIDHGPMTVRQIVNEIDHHYQSDKGACSALLPHFWREDRFYVDDSAIPHMIFALDENGKRIGRFGESRFQQALPMDPRGEV